MSAATSHEPKYRHFKPKNLGVVRIDGRDYYLGKYDTDERFENYHRLLPEWRACGIGGTRGQNEATASEALTVTEHCARG